MITSESHNDEIHRFFKNNSVELAYRLKNLIEKKYKRIIVPIIQRGGEIPPIFGTLKIDDIQIYGQPKGLRYQKGMFQVADISFFLVMKDLRKQTRIMVTCSHPHAIVYSTHAISRYKERIGLNNDMDFVDVCKHMYIAGCGHPRSVIDTNKVHGTNINRRVVNLMISNGAFLGYFYGETGVIYAETFLSTKELREDQAFMDASINTDLKQWEENHQLFLEGKLSIEELREKLYPLTRISINKGQIEILNQEQIEEENKLRAKRIAENPTFLEDQIEPNRQKAINRIKRKGYK